MLRAMKHHHNATLITLKDLPQEGREFSYTRESGELNQALKDLVGNNSYQVHFKIIPMGNSFDLKGQVNSSMDLQCSLCAIDFKYPLVINLHELLVIDKPLAKGDQMSRANHAHEWESEGPDYILLKSDAFNVAEYIHEMIALAEPLRPLGRPDCDEMCENIKDRVQRPWLSFGEEEQAATGVRSNPFQILEKIKLKS
jgi:uncharacterized metal-binding protein YceD (DUF177 family)